MQDHACGSPALEPANAVHQTGLRGRYGRLSKEQRGGDKGQSDQYGVWRLHNCHLVGFTKLAGPSGPFYRG